MRAAIIKIFMYILFFRVSDRGTLLKGCNRIYKVCNNCRTLQKNHLNDDAPTTPTFSVIQQQEVEHNSTSSSSEDQQQFPTAAAGITSSISSPHVQQNQMTVSESIITDPLPRVDSLTRQEISAVVEESNEKCCYVADEETADDPHACGDAEEVNAVLQTITATTVEPATAISTTSSTTDNEPPELALLACQFFPFQCNTGGSSCSSSKSGDEDRAVEAAIKGISKFSHYTNIDINYQGENIHGMVNEEETHISPLGNKNADQLISFRNRRGKVFYVTDLNPSRSCADVIVVIAWKVNVNDTFGILHVLSFDEYICCLENR